MSDSSKVWQDERAKWFSKEETDGPPKRQRIDAHGTHLTIPLIHKNNPTNEDEIAARVITDALNYNNANEHDVRKHAAEAIPLLAQNALHFHANMSEKAKFAKDVDTRPDVASLDDYERTPIEDFGAAMMRGMGWKEGKVVGKSQKNGLLKPIEMKSRARLLGLGATALPVPERHNHPEKAQQSKPASQAPLPLQNIRQYAEAPPIGAYIKIIEGRHSGLVGTVVKIQAHHINIQIENSSEIVTVSTDQVKPKSSSKQSRIKWVQPHIKLRITSKSLGQGRLYNVKGIVQEVLRDEFVIKTDAGALIEGLVEKNVETIIPAVGSSVMILKSKGEKHYIGQIARIMQKDKASETVVVQLSSDFEIMSFKFDDISEWVDLL